MTVEAKLDRARILVDALVDQAINKEKIDPVDLLQAALEAAGRCFQFKPTEEKTTFVYRGINKYLDWIGGADDQRH
jgi:hypothetical protein